MQTSTFKQFCELAYERAGIKLSEGKEALVSARVAKRQRALKIEDADAYLAFLRADQSGQELALFLDAISTNYTFFFREPGHFEILDELVRLRLRQGARRIRFWSAAASSGEEPYSMAITIMDALQGRSVDWRILATDISTRMIETADRGVYPRERLKNLAPGRLRRHFEQVLDDRGQPAYRVQSHLRSHIALKRLNLSRPPFAMRGPFDMIFCRNVMIYFDQRVRQGLVREIQRLLAPDGVLVVGHAESLTGLGVSLVAQRPSVYRQPAPVDVVSHEDRP